MITRHDIESVRPSHGPAARATGLLALALAACWLAAAPARAEIRATSACPAKVFNNDLIQPRVIQPVSGTVDTSLTVRLLDIPCVPVWNNGWQWQDMKLRTYGSPVNGNNPNDPNLMWTIPGPTFRIRKAYLKDDTQPPGPTNPQVSDGTRFKLSLRNQLPNNSYPYHQCDPASVTVGSTTYPEKSPECFHGADVTNIHYHGTHVSPQPHQDFVLLELFSAQQTNPPPPPPSENVAIGSYQTDMNPIPWNQAPGTHWYHPHKHGSTALQVLNGMAGALLIQGPFDDWLYKTYGVDPTNRAKLEAFEKVLVVQQVFDQINFFNPAPPAGYPPQPLIDGQADPVIEMAWGEVQRWRFIGATMQASAQIQIGFPAGFTVKQIAQDGVQFAPENWQRQPLMPSTAGASIKLAPGNRVDFLVQAPPPPAKTAAGAAGAARQRYSITFQILGELADAAKKPLEERRQQRLKALAAAGTKAASPSLFTIDVGGPASPMQLPCPYGTPGKCAQYPAMPWYLRDIQPSEIKGNRTVAFSMTDPVTGLATAPGVQPNGFWIDKTQYDASCANQTMQLGTAEQWTVTNDSAPNHPFHIHINPFQMLRNDTTTYQPPYPWQDVVALPGVTCADVNAGPLYDQQQAAATCPGVCAAYQGPPAPPPAYSWNGQWRTTVPGQQSVCGCCKGPAVKSVEFRSRFEDYTGGYVIHCHFLGHEDRGMMHNVQTVCPASTPDQWKYGKTQASGLGDDCSQTSPVPALPPCTGYSGADAHSHH